jgi:DNA polymerase-3 subunit epsilon
MTNEKHPLVLGIDLEGINEDINSGVNIKKDRVIEIGAVLWDWTLAQPVQFISDLINEPDRLPISEEVANLTGISEELLEEWGLKGESIHASLHRLAALMDKADYFMAHNAHQYDLPMLEGMFKRYDLQMPEKPWIDTLNDIEFPSKINGRSMALLEHGHGFVNPFPHRAMTDVLSMLKIASQYPLTRMVKLATSPMVTIAASLSAPNWKDQEDVERFNKIKNKVARSRFRWNPSDKTWIKTIHQVLIDEGKINFDFEWYIKEQ